MSGIIRLWHGGKRWENPPQIRLAAKGRAECGSGIYLTTHYMTASKYAKGGGAVFMVELDANTSWLGDTRWPLEKLKHFTTTLPRLRNRAAILADLDRSGRRHPGEPIPVSYLVNLFVNHDVSHGESGRALTNWLAEEGVGASIEPQSGDEEWIVVFDPRSILRVRRLLPAEDHLRYTDFPKVKAQLAALAHDGEMAQESDSDIILRI